MNGYENIYENLKQRLRACDFPEIAERLGLFFESGDYLSADFLGVKYKITRGGVYPENNSNSQVNINNLNVLAYYVLSNGAGEPKNSFSPLHSFSGMAVAGRKNNTDWMLDPLHRELNGKSDKLIELAKAAEKLGGVRENGNSWIFRVLPKILLKLIYYEEDEEFPFEIRILFDDNSARFLEFECLAFLQGCFVKALTENLQI